MSIRFRRFTPAVLALVILAACDEGATAPTAVSMSAARVRAAPVTLEWQQTARDLAVSRNMNPLVGWRMFAASSMAAMRAVESVDAAADASAGGAGGHGYGPGGRSRYEARRGAVAGASSRVLASFVPAVAADLDATLARQGDAGHGRIHPDFTRGVEIGRAAADAVIEHVSNDGFTTPWTGSIPVGAGLWTTSVLPPGGVMLGQVTPWFLTSGDQFRPAPPPAYLSPVFNADLEELFAITSSLTAEQRAIAIAWLPVGFWNELAATYVAADDLNEAEAAKVFGLMSAAVFDALIACFEAKYHYWMLRPHQADPAIATVFTVPNYPAYPSGHANVSTAAARILAHFFPHHQSELNALVEEAAMSRLYAGIHYRFDMTAARVMAEKIADFVIDNAD